MTRTEASELIQKLEEEREKFAAQASVRIGELLGRAAMLRELLGSLPEGSVVASTSSEQTSEKNSAQN